MERDFKGVWICKEIWLDNKLTWMEKLFITEINSLDKEKGCFASNNYFADFFNVSPGRCSQIISSLIKKGYMSAEYIKKGKEIEKRVLRILNTPIKNSKGGIKNIKDEYLENDKDNNTLINNTINNINESFEKFWNLYDFKKDRKKCETKWKYIKQKDHDTIFGHVKKYIESTPNKQYRKNPLTYLNGECWNDEITNNKQQITDAYTVIK